MLSHIHNISPPRVSRLRGSNSWGGPEPVSPRQPLSEALAQSGDKPRVSAGEDSRGGVTAEGERPMGGRTPAPARPLLPRPLVLPGRHLQGRSQKPRLWAASYADVCGGGAA